MILFNNKTKRLAQLTYILDNDVEINIKFKESINININRKETFDNQLDTIINYLNYYGIDYDIGTIHICFKIFNKDILIGTIKTLNITKDDLEILDKEQMINLLNSILDITDNSDFIKLEINTYDLGYNPYQE